MILNSAHCSTEISGREQAPSCFKIVVSPVLFRTLSDSLYQQKVTAPIRELSCNAWDAHMSAGKPEVPFEVHLPTQFEPYFSVTDNGTGMEFVKGGCNTCHGTGNISPRDEGATHIVPCEECNGSGDYDSVKQIYCSYCTSTKREDANAIGFYGLGSKSPFAYLLSRSTAADASGGFSVVNHYNGQTFAYTAFVGADGFPDIALDEVTETPDTPNGVTVQFPVDTRDIWEFENKAASVFEFFDPKPILNKSIEITKTEYSLKTDKWGMRTYSETEQGTYLRAIQGRVPYAIGNIDISRLSPSQQKLVTMPLDLFFNLGDLEIPPSRESLQLNNRTVEKILKTLDEIGIALLDEVKKQVGECHTPWEARLMIHNLSLQKGRGKLVNDAFNCGKLYGSYPSFSLLDRNLTINELDYSAVTLVEYKHNHRSASRAKTENLFHGYSQNVLVLVAQGVRGKSFYDIKFTADGGTLFIINDLKTPTGMKYVNYLIQKEAICQGTHFNTAVVINKLTKETSDVDALKEAFDIIEKLGNPPSVLASELKTTFDPQLAEFKVRNPSKPRERMGIKQLKPSIGRYHRGAGWPKAWEDGSDNAALADTLIPKYYVVLRGGSTDASGNSGCYSARDFRDFMDRVIGTGLFGITSDTPIFGLKEKSKLIGKPDFIELRPYLVTQLKGILTPARQLAMSLNVCHFSSDWDVFLQYLAEDKPLASTSKIQIFAKQLYAAKNNSEKEVNSNLKSIAYQLGNSGLITNVTNFQDLWKGVVKNYPMLQICLPSNYHYATMEDKKVLIEYLESVDNQNKTVYDFGVSTIEAEEEEEDTSNA